MSASRHTYAVCLKRGHVDIHSNDNWPENRTYSGFSDCHVIIFDGDALAVFGSEKQAKRVCAEMVNGFGDHYEVIQLR